MNNRIGGRPPPTPPLSRPGGRGSVISKSRRSSVPSPRLRGEGQGEGKYCHPSSRFSIACGAAQQFFDIASHALLDRQERRIVTARAQGTNVGLGVALVFPPEFRRERDVFDDALLLHVGETQRRLVGVPAARLDRRGPAIVEALRGARADVAKAGFPG